MGMVPSERAGHSAIVYGEKLFMFGGEDPSGNTNDLFIFDFSKIEWKRVQTIGTPPSPRSYHTSAFIPANEL